MAIDLNDLAQQWAITPQAAKYTLREAGVLDMCERRAGRYIIPPEAVEKASQWRAARAYKKPAAVDIRTAVMEQLGKSLALAAQVRVIEARRQGASTEAINEWLARFNGVTNLLMLALEELPTAPLSDAYSEAIRRQAETMDGDQWLEEFKRGMLETSMSLEATPMQRELAMAFLREPEETQRAIAEAERRNILAGAK